MTDLNLAAFSQSQLEDCIKVYNEAYRKGDPVITDAEYDALTEELRLRDPENELLTTVGPEPEAVFGKKVKLPIRMLSTQKAYTMEALQKWCAEVQRVANMLGVPATLRVTPKLDGYAAYYDGDRMFTRGDGYTGSDITHFADRSLAIICGQGEIVVDREYFNEALADKFENSRNVIAAALKEGELHHDIRSGIACGDIRFQPFILLNDVKLQPIELIPTLDSLWGSLVDGSAYDTDGLVIEMINEAVKDEMGSTNHHHRWQIAYKRNTEYHDVKVRGLTWQTAKSGRITPVVELEPTRISGVTVSRATGHHAGNVLKNGIDEGAVVRVCRSGQVIPYISEVVTPAPFGMVAHPGECPSCGTPTSLEGDNLTCTNTLNCSAQVAGKLEHFFKTIGNCDGFGPKVCEQLVKAGVDGIYDLYKRASVGMFREMGFGDKTSENLWSELAKSSGREIEDWRFLAAFGIPSFGPANCEKLLKAVGIDYLYDLSVHQALEIEGFGEKMAADLFYGLATIREGFLSMVRAFNLKTTSTGAVTGVLSGKTVCFTGTMENASRKEMEATAKQLGATVVSSVSKKTDYLVCGTNVGAAKTTSAAKNGVTVLSEAEYLSLIG